MKNWFTNLEKGKQKIALISGWCVTFILLLMFAAVPSEQEELVKKTSINPKCFRNCLNGVQKHAGGYVWKYENEQ